MLIPYSGLQRIFAKLSTCGIDAVLGGSGLLHALGLTEVVNDWDLTTDAPFETVLECLEEFHVVYGMLEADWPGKERTSVYAAREDTP